MQSVRERGRFPFIATIVTNGGKSEKHSVRQCVSKWPSKSLDCRRIKFVTRERRDKHCSEKDNRGANRIKKKKRRKKYITSLYVIMLKKMKINSAFMRLIDKYKAWISIFMNVYL